MRRWSVLPSLIAHAPARVLVVVGAVTAVLGVLIVARPLTSLVLLGLYVGASAVISGVIELATSHRSARGWTRAVAVLWIIGGILVIVWLGRSLELLPPVLAALLILGGVASLGEGVARGRVSARVLAAAWGGAQIAFGILSLTWPDVTVLVVAVVFGVRTLVFGASLLVRGILGLNRRNATVEQHAVPAPRGRFGWADAGRYGLSLLLVAVATVGWSLNDWLREGAPVIDAFYSAPVDVPAQHGTLIRFDDYEGDAPPGGVVQRILYTTTDADGRPAVGSGLVITSSDPLPGPRPVVLWNHGTTGVARGCAPSLRDNSATRWAIPALDEVLKRGWIVVAPDYSGQGTAGAFPYLIGQGEARSALDAVRAAAELPQRWLAPDVVVWGHSQGGHAALWTSKIARAYTPELHVLGTAALAPVADPHALARDLLSGGASPELTVLISWVLVPYAQAYPDVRISDYVAPGAMPIVREMAQRCPTEQGVIVSVLAALGVSEDRPLYVGDLTGGSLGERLQQNAVTGKFAAPLLVAWGSKDEVIPKRLQDRFVERMCAEGNQVRWREYSGVNHLGVLQPGSPFLSLLVTWTDDLFVGRPSVTDECPG